MQPKTEHIINTFVFLRYILIHVYRTHFSDMTEERNMLMASVFPDLKNYCQQKYKREFQVRAGNCNCIVVVKFSL